MITLQFPVMRGGLDYSYNNPDSNMEWSVIYVTLKANESQVFWEIPQLNNGIELYGKVPISYDFKSYKQIKKELLKKYGTVLLLRKNEASGTGRRFIFIEEHLNGGEFYLDEFKHE